MTKQLPYWLNKDFLNSHASLREKKTTMDKKFGFLIKKNQENLFKYSLSEECEKEAKDKEFRKKLNQRFYTQALLILNKKEFAKQIIELATESGLLKIKYDLFDFDFYLYKSSPAINAWEARLGYLSLLNRQIKIDKKEQCNSLFDFYLLPKFKEKVYILMYNFGLEFFWYESIVHLLLTGFWYLPRHSSVIELPMQEDKIEYLSIVLRISSFTSKEEISYRWKEVEKWQKSFFPNDRQRNKNKNISSEFDYLFANKLKALAELRGKGEQDITKKKKAIDKKIGRASKEFDNFLLNYKLLPSEIKNQMEYLDQYGIENYYYF